jgi:hypothetical protein
LPTPFEQLTPYAGPVATVCAALVAAVAGYMAGGWKVREVKLAYEQRIRDTYLENARKVTGDVYVPLAIAISHLTKAYGEFRLHIDFDQLTAPQGAANRFKGSCNNFKTMVDDLFARGGSAYLTLPLEEELSDFALFLAASQSATGVTKKLTLSPRFYGTGTSHVILSGARAVSFAAEIARTLSAAASLTLPLAGIQFGVREDTIASPLTSREFEQRLQVSTIRISSLIKEVTLGSRTAPA